MHEAYLRRRHKPGIYCLRVARAGVLQHHKTACAEDDTGLMAGLLGTDRNSTSKLVGSSRCSRNAGTGQPEALIHRLHRMVQEQRHRTYHLIYMRSREKKRTKKDSSQTKKPSVGGTQKAIGSQMPFTDGWG